MARDAEAIKDLIYDELPRIYAAIERGDVKDECMDFSEQLLVLLKSHGEDVIMVQSRDKDGEPLHHFLLWREAGTEAPVMIDPTFSQLFPEQKEIFIGTRDDLREDVLDNYDYHTEKHGAKARKTFDKYWPETLYLYRPTEEHPEVGEAQQSAFTMKSQTFQDKWNAESAFKVIQREKYSKKSDVASKATATSAAISTAGESTAGEGSAATPPLKRRNPPAYSGR